MRSFVFSGIAVCALVLFASWQLTLDHFTANYQGTNMKLEWQLSSEDGVIQYEVARKRPDETAYTKLTTVMASSQGVYNFIDETLYKDQQSQTISLSYRLGVKTTSGTVTYFVNVSNSPTAVQRSWGSIKSMFQ
jgi:hypothetical protein